ncbi:MAG: hypothetical protein ACOYT4_00320 [Nanoarchaeota archaeon]
MINSKQIQKEYLGYMNSQNWSIWNSKKLINSTFPTCFVISGAVDWFNKKIIENPLIPEAYVTYQRCFRHFDEPDKTHQPFFWMLLTISWDKYSREKVIEDNYKFATGILGLKSENLLFTVWQGGNIYGLGINTNEDADIERINQGKEFDNMKKYGINMPRDEEAINAWLSQGIKNNQILEVGELDLINNKDAILLNSREHFAGVRSEPYYLNQKTGKYHEIGVFLHESHIKKTFAKRLNVLSQGLEDSLNKNSFLLKLKPKISPGGFGLERLTMAMNEVSDVYEIEPLTTLKDILMNSSNEKPSYIILKDNSTTYGFEHIKNLDKEKIVENAASYLHCLPWFIKDSAQNLSIKKDRQRTGIYRKVLRTILVNMQSLGCDNYKNYDKLLREVINFYSDSIERIGDIKQICIREIDNQRKRIDNYA